MQQNFIKKNKKLWVIAAAVVCLVSTSAVMARSDIYNNKGAKVGYVDDNGSIYDNVTGFEGRVSADGSVFGKDQKLVGRVDRRTGIIFDKNNVQAGRYDMATGMIYHKDGSIAGHLQKDGNVYAADASYVGRVKPGNIFGALMLLLKR